MARIDTSKYRRDLIKRLSMTEDEQTWCWARLWDIQMTAAHSTDSEWMRQSLDALNKRLSWLRSEDGRAWQKQKREEQDAV